jgi:predicted exporter
MKSPESVLRSALIADATVSGLVGSRIYPVLAPASAALPFVTWRRTGIEREQTLGNPMGVPRVTIEFSIYGTTYNQARQAADSMRVILDGYGGTADNTQVRQTSLENEVDDFVNLQGADLPPVYQITQTYDCWWQET